MLTKRLKDDVMTWITLAELSFGFGNNITNARFHAIRAMIEWRLEILEMMHESAYRVPIEAAARLLEYAGRSEVSAGEKQIYNHLFLDVCKSLLSEIDNPTSGGILEKTPLWRVPAVVEAKKSAAADTELLQEALKLLVMFANAAREIPGSMRSTLYMKLLDDPQPENPYKRLSISTDHLVLAERFFWSHDFSDMDIAMHPYAPGEEPVKSVSPVGDSVTVSFDGIHIEGFPTREQMQKAGEDFLQALNGVSLEKARRDKLVNGAWENEQPKILLKPGQCHFTHDFTNVACKECFNTPECELYSDPLVPTDYVPSYRQPDSPGDVPFGGYVDGDPLWKTNEEKRRQNDE